MKERGILFSASMVRALLAGTKTQTRRTVSPRVLRFIETPPLLPGRGRGRVPAEASPYGVAGDRLWVREACLLGDDDCPTHQLGYPPGSPCWCGDIKRVVYRADPPAPGRKAEEFGWRPSIHMPRWASRITLEIDEVRVQRLQEITLDDARAEGIPQMFGEARDLGLTRWAEGDTVEGNAGGPNARDVWDNRTSVENYAALWDHLNAERAQWESDPWVWALTFRRLP